MIRIALGIALLLLGAAPGGATGSSPAAPAGNAPPQFLRFSVEDGLSQNTIQAILQDRSGFLWIGTEEGLNRYDGYSFTVFKHSEDRPGSLPDNIANALCEDRAGRLWVGTRLGLALYDRRTETFRLVLATPNDVRAIVADDDGTLWVGTFGDGLYRVGADGAVLAHYKKEGTGDASLGDNQVTALLRDHLGLVWVATVRGGLSVLDVKARRFAHYRHEPRDPKSLPADAIDALAEDDNGSIWVGTQASGVSILDRVRGSFRHHRLRSKDATGLEAELVLSVQKDRSGTMWLGTGAGLRRYVRATDSFVSYRSDPDNAQALSGDVIRSLYVDVQGNLWIGTFSAGLNLLRRSRPGFSLFVHDPKNPASLLNDSTLSFLEDRDGAIWVGTEEGGVHRFDRATGSLTRYRHGHAAILCFHQDRRGRIWVGTYASGLSLFDPVRGTFTPYRGGEGAEHDVVWDIDEEASGVLWLATDDGLVKLDVDRHELTRLRHEAANPDSPGMTFVRSLLRDEDGNLWVGTLGGLDRRRPDGHFDHYRNDPANPRSLIHDTVHSLFRDREGRMWVATIGGGLGQFDEKSETFVGYGRKEGLPSSVIYGILEDEAGLLWLSTTRGLCRFDPRTGRALGFDPTVGLPSRVFTQGKPLRTRSGSLLFGSTRGFYFFDPRTTVPNPEVPRLVMTALKVLGQPKALEVALSEADDFTLSHRDSVFSLEFAVLDFTFPRRNQYAYKLDEAGDWISLGPRRDVTFTHLAPGAHVLRIKGSNSDGVWDEKGLVTQLVVTPPFWATWWFRSACLAAVVALVLLAHRLRVRHLVRNERQLKARVAEALSRVKTLRGLVPICAACKKVRDDKGYWNAIDSYLRDHADAKFSHDRCPECVASDGKASSGPGASVAVLVALTLLAGEGQASTPLAASAAARFRRLSSEQGLSNDNVNAIYQDRVGFLWFGTEEGLSRYDGYGFTVFDHDPARPESLPDSYIAATLEDRSGRLLVATAGGLSVFDRRTETFAEILSVGVTALLEDRHGRLWVGSRESGLYRFSPGEKDPVSFRSDPTNPSALSSDRLLSLLEDHEGRIWVGTMGGGLNLVDVEHNRFLRYRHDAARADSLAEDTVWSLDETASGEIWAGTNGGVSVLDPGRRTFRHHVFRLDETSAAPVVVTSVHRDHAGTMWVGTDGGGLYHAVDSEGTFVVYRNDPNGTETLSGNVIRTIYEDVQGNLWMGMFNRGVSLLRRSDDRFVYYRHKPNDDTSLSTSNVKSFLEDRDGGLWVGTDPAGLHRFDRRKGTFARYDSGGYAVMAMHQDRKGRIWVATYGNGLAELDPARGTMRRFRPFPALAESGRGAQVWSIHEDADGTLWLATDAGVVRIDAAGGGATRRRAPATDAHATERDFVRAFARDRNGDLWIATLGGLDRMTTRGELVHYEHDARRPRTLSHDWVTSLHEDARGRLWAGTYGGGLNLVDSANGSFTAYKEAAGLPSDVVQAILEDDDGRLWLSTSRGLCRFDPDSKKPPEVYDLTNGLESLQFSLGAALRTVGGSMFFGSADGLYVFDPRKVAPGANPAPVVFTSLRVFGSSERRVPLSGVGEVTLPHGDNVFSVEFAVLDFTSPRASAYAYKLEGVNDRWIALGTKRDVTFSRLAPGTYVFSVKASSTHGLDDKATSLRIVIRPPFWATWWWRTACALALLAALLFAHRLRVQRLRVREQILSARVEEALSKVKVLRGVLPICPTCKKVKDDQGYWKWIESYVREHSEADFSHGLCPQCFAELYPDFVKHTTAQGEANRDR